MEVCLDAVGEETPPEDTFVSVRIGEAHKQTRYVPSRTHRFPASACRESFGRIEIFKRVGTAIVDFDNSASEALAVDVPCKYPGMSKLSWRMSVKRLDLGAASLQDTKASHRKAKMTAAQQYLEKHRLESTLADAVQEILSAKPTDPCSFLSKRILGRPSSTPALEPVPAARMACSLPKDSFDSPSPKTPARRTPSGTLPPITRDELSCDAAMALKATPPVLPPRTQEEPLADVAMAAKAPRPACSGSDSNRDEKPEETKAQSSITGAHAKFETPTMQSLDEPVREDEIEHLEAPSSGIIACQPHAAPVQEEKAEVSEARLSKAAETPSSMTTACQPVAPVQQEKVEVSDARPSNTAAAVFGEYSGKLHLFRYSGKLHLASSHAKFGMHASQSPAAPVQALAFPVQEEQFHVSDRGITPAQFETMLEEALAEEKADAKAASTMSTMLQEDRSTLLVLEEAAATGDAARSMSLTLDDERSCRRPSMTVEDDTPLSPVVREDEASRPPLLRSERAHALEEEFSPKPPLGSTLSVSQELRRISELEDRPPIHARTSMVPLAGPLRYRLRVTIVKATNLRNADWGSLSDPYCVLQVRGERLQHFRTRVINDDLYPVWDEGFDFEYEPGDELLFSVWDKDFGKKDDFLGRGSLNARFFWPDGIDDYLVLRDVPGNPSRESRLYFRIQPMF